MMNFSSTSLASTSRMPVAVMMPPMTLATMKVISRPVMLVMPPRLSIGSTMSTPVDSVKPLAA